MDYSRICEVYERLEGTSKGLEKTDIIVSFLGETNNCCAIIDRFAVRPPSAVRPLRCEMMLGVVLLFRLGF